MRPDQWRRAVCRWRHGLRWYQRPGADSSLPFPHAAANRCGAVERPSSGESTPQPGTVRADLSLSAAAAPRQRSTSTYSSGTDQLTCAAVQSAVYLHTQLSTIGMHLSPRAGAARRVGDTMGLKPPLVLLLMWRPSECKSILHVSAIWLRADRHASIKQIVHTVERQ